MEKEIEDIPTDKLFVKSIGGYLIKVGTMYAISYSKNGILDLGYSDVKELSPYLGKVKQLLHNEEQAKLIAEKVNGKVYQLAFEPVDDD